MKTLPSPMVQSVQRSILFFLFLGAFIFQFDFLHAQSFDHTPHPRLDFDFTELNLQLGLQPQNLQIDGAATYQIKANIDEADTVILQAARLDISSASIDGNEADFSLQNDSLFIPLSEPAKEGETFELRIRYSAAPKFGLLKNKNNMVWSSQLPRSQRHWVPIVDNPHVTFQTELNISVPSEYNVIATGSKVGEEPVNESVITYRFSSTKEIPASTLALAVGQFTNETTTYGIKKINVAVEQGLSDSVDSQQLLRNAYDWLETVERNMQSEFPYEWLNIIVTADHNWETKSWGASTVFLYQNRGDLQHQLLRGIIAQWIGTKQRAGQWKEGAGITLYQTLVQQSINDSIPYLKVEDQPALVEDGLYAQYGPKNWNGWQDRWVKWKGQSWGGVISQSHPALLQQLLPVVSWNDYANYWYQKSGQPMFEAPGMKPRNVSDTSATAPEAAADSVVYRVIYQPNQTGDAVVLNFEAVEGGYDELVTLSATEVYDGGQTESDEATFTGINDSITLAVSPGLRTLQLQVPDDLNLKLLEQKPVSFLLYELRNAQTVEQRAQAAHGLGSHADNPDLQLAVMDALDSDIEPRVRAGLLSSLADITAGAAGTEQVFMDALQSNHPVVQKAGLKALQRYPENQESLDRIKQITMNTDQTSIFKEGLTSLSELISTEELNTFIGAITQQDSVGERSLLAIQHVAKRGQTENIVDQVAPFLDSEYPYSIRKIALNILIDYDTSAESWLIRGQESLTNAADPRIRYWVVQGLLKNKNASIHSFLEEYAADEYDERVYRAITEGL
ncbi:hypothetical protein [Fodinibius salsisoli]|uniref:Aminopeptidase N-like N-terminal domain-containing protein n=1 Tax=Fodinibius salsisoli TaxID=2820877 RepID=A0ABT3PKZ9_9BACT|nr:hypothetical protein [Fodinibius salsisoli]MCW9706621.1 hypothetical protein [Fodinibius salsisoli]